MLKITLPDGNSYVTDKECCDKCYEEIKNQLVFQGHPGGRLYCLRCWIKYGSAETNGLWTNHMAEIEEVQDEVINSHSA